MNRIYRKCNRSKTGYNNGDIDVAFQLFRCGCVWDGALASKESRDYLVSQGFAVRHEGGQSLTGKGIVAFLRHHRTWVSAHLRRKLWRKPALVASTEEVRRALS